ncbi:hypothetical protein KY284_024095 [Solanum tuberosum]|nr:hypothetical protein KY284_024095 [Solanum tuberosum]
MSIVDNKLPEKLSQNHPLFLHTIYNFGVFLSSIQLVGADNYFVWSRSMKMQFHVVTSLDSLTVPEMLGGIFYSTNVVVVWNDLREDMIRSISFELNALFTNQNPTPPVLRSTPPHTSTYDPNAFCDYCKRACHTQAICYQLHGYPSGYERKKKGQYSPNTGRGRPHNEMRQYQTTNNVVSDFGHNHRSAGDLDYNKSISAGNHGESQGYDRGTSQTDQSDYHKGTERASTSHSSANLAQEYPSTGPLQWASEANW